jgi:precorrin-6B methylase 2
MMHQAFRSGRFAPITLAAAALIAISASTFAQIADRPALDVPYVPTPPEVVDLMLQMAGVGPSDFVIDLGSGDGRIAVAAGKLGAHAFGVDIDPQRIEEAQENARKAGVQDKVTFAQQNLFETKIADATVLTMYLLTKVNMDLRPRILEELKPGTRVVSHAFNLGDWQPDNHASVGYRQVYMWTVPAKVQGRWQVQNGAEGFSLDLMQQFQNFSGSAQTGGKAIDVREGRMHGAEIRFTLADGRKFHGRVSGEQIESLQSPDNAAGTWRAERTP